MQNSVMLDFGCVKKKERNTHEASLVINHPGGIGLDWIVSYRMGEMSEQHIINMHDGAHIWGKRGAGDQRTPLCR